MQRFDTDVKLVGAAKLLLLTPVQAEIQPFCLEALVLLRFRHLLYNWSLCAASTALVGNVTVDSGLRAPNAMEYHQKPPPKRLEPDSICPFLQKCTATHPIFASLWFSQIAAKLQPFFAVGTCSASIWVHSW